MLYSHIQVSMKTHNCSQLLWKLNGHLCGRLMAEGCNPLLFYSTFTFVSNIKTLSQNIMNSMKLKPLEIQWFANLQHSALIKIIILCTMRHFDKYYLVFENTKTFKVKCIK